MITWRTTMLLAVTQTSEDTEDPSCSEILLQRNPPATSEEHHGTTSAKISSLLSCTLGWGYPLYLLCGNTDKRVHWGMLPLDQS